MDEENNYPMTQLEDGSWITMGDMIMKPKADEVVIYVNGDHFDCRRENLRVIKRPDWN